MNDFYAQLERQLVEAGRRRAGSGRSRLALAGRVRPLLVVAAAVLALVAAIAVAPALRPGSSSEPGGSAAPPAPPVTTPRPAATPPAGRAPLLLGIVVAVFNATTTTGVAREVADLLEAYRATISVIGSDADQSLAQTVVVYRRGAEVQARRVANVLGVRDVRPQPVDEDSALATVARVFVRVGYDLSQTMTRRGPAPRVVR